MRARFVWLLALLLTACAANPPAATPTIGASLAATAQLSPRLAPTLIPTLNPRLFINPVLNVDFPDPDTLKVGGLYYAFATNTGSTHIQVARSADLVQWTLLADALPSLPAWADAEPGWEWAPEVSAFDGGYVMYFVARFKVEAGGRQCIGVATSDQPDQPFRVRGDAPLICDIAEGGDIDPGLFVDDDGTRYLLWKNDGYCCGGQTWIYIQKISADGLTRLGERTRLITADKTWEGVLVEAPTLWKRNGKYYLFYSANDYASPRYAVGYAIADCVLGPYRKPDEPLLATSMKDGVIGPGGQDIVRAPSGETWLLYDAWAAGGYRNLNLDRLTWNGDMPSVQPSRHPQARP